MNMSISDEPASEASLAIIFTGSVYDVGSGPLAEFQITNENALIEGIGARGNKGATFLMTESQIEKRIADRTAQGRACEESESGLAAIKAFKSTTPSPG